MATSTDVRALKTSVDRRFTKVGENMNTLDSEFQAMRTTMEQRISLLEAKLSALEKSISSVNVKASKTGTTRKMGRFTVSDAAASS